MIELVNTSPKFAEIWSQWRTEPNSLRYNPIMETTLEKLRERMSAMSSDFSDLKAAQEFQFFVRQGDDMVASLTLKNISYMMMYGEIGYGVGEAFQGKGIGTKAVTAFVDKIFSETQLRRLFAFVAEDNIPSCKLLERVGFVREGLCREHYIVNGNPTNEVLYGMLRKDWPRSKNG